ncbi:MAG: DUF3160 domain-containing protein [Caldilinea sp. CFX5]|nr:DUF3160 domain-containing protein [Caldilinea sp. CFX5]
MRIDYVKQSFTTAGVTCEYPAGYVEPCPAFYQCLNPLAENSYAALNALAVAGAGDYATQVKTRALAYFTALQQVSAQLQTLAEPTRRMMIAIRFTRRGCFMSPPVRLPRSFSLWLPIATRRLPAATHLD